MGYDLVDTDPNVLTKQCKLEWVDEDKLVSWSKQVDSMSPSFLEVDVPSVLKKIDDMGRKLEVFTIVNAIDFNACSYAMVQDDPSGKRKLSEGDYTRYLWGATPKELIAFLKRGYEHTE